MAFYEKPFYRDGVRMPIQCITPRLENTTRPTQLHYHEYTELLFGVSGTAQVFIGAKQYALPAGGMVIVHTGCPHDVACSNGKCTYIVVKFLPQVLLADEQTPSAYGYVLALMENTGEKQILFPPSALADTTLPALFYHIRSEWEEQALGYELSLRADVTQIYLYILRCWEAQHVPLLSRIRDMGQTEFVKHAIAYVQTHYSDLTAVETADACGVSATYFSRMFKRAMHQSFSDYVTLVRLRHAEQLLLLTDDSVTEVAQAVGFSTASYFISRFRAAKKMTPLQFRQAAKSTAAKGDAPCPENGT